MNIQIVKLTKYGSLAASTRQRFDQYDKFLGGAGCSTQSWPLLEDEYIENLYAGRGRSRSYVLQRYLTRAVKLIRSPDVDLIWVHCEVFPYLPGLVDRLAGLYGKPIVFDFDDAIFHNYDQSNNRLIRALLGKKLKHLLKMSDLAFCGNKYLQTYANKYCSSTKIVPTVLDTALYTPANKSDFGIGKNIGWIGTPTTWSDYMKPMLPLLTEVASKNAAKVIAIGASTAARIDSVLELRPWLEATEVAEIQAMDIGIMPLTDTPWSRGKCGYKLIQYMACGLPVVASPVGVNAEIVEHGVNGFLASTKDEWRDALNALLQDADLRRRMGAAGRSKVEAEYSLQVWGPRVASMLKNVAEGHKG